MDHSAVPVSNPESVPGFPFRTRPAGASSPPPSIPTPATPTPAPSVSSTPSAMTKPSPTPLLLDTLPSSTTRAGASRGPPFQPRRVPASPPSHRPGASLRPPPSYGGRPSAPRAARIPHAEPQDLRPSAPHTTAVYPEARPPRGRLRCLNCADALRADRPSTGRAIVLSFPAFRAGFGLPRRTVQQPNRVRSPPGAYRGPCDLRGCPIPTRLRFPPAPGFRRSASRL